MKPAVVFRQSEPARRPSVEREAFFPRDCGVVQHRQERITEVECLDDRGRSERADQVQ
jgi:hypothetical protein